MLTADICVMTLNKTFKLARRSIVAKRKIIEGSVIKEEDIIAKRPGTGISASKFFEIIE